MLTFLTDEELSKHKEYHERLRHACSLTEKRTGITLFGGVDEYSCHEKLWYRASRRLNGEELELFGLERLHSVYFHSFCAGSFQQSTAVRELFGSESSLLHRLFIEGMKLGCGFVGLLNTKRGITVFAERDAKTVMSRGTPLLAIDLYEHAYYGDYSFDKESYLKTALSHLRLSAIDEYS
ncbi:MAG: hypothetical protein IKC87_06565 [Clostridia bacterium]|nr:hypothetical protein [Clostridia bacterium]